MTRPDDPQPEATVRFDALFGPADEPWPEPEQDDESGQEDEPEREQTGGGGRGSRTRHLAPVLLVALALLLVLGAYAVGRAVSGGDEAEPEKAADSPSAGVSAGSGPSAPAAKAYAGPVEAVPIAEGSATCQTDDSIDAAGNPTSYEPAKAFDQDLTTAWRCDGSGVGQRFTVELPGDTVVAEVGIVPGYAKTDPLNDVDRYAENNRLTKVRWTFDDGTSYVQEMTGDPADRSLRTMRLPRTTSSRVVLEILASAPGQRNTVAISELRVASVRG